MIKFKNEIFQQHDFIDIYTTEKNGKLRQSWRFKKKKQEQQNSVMKLKTENIKNDVYHYENKSKIQIFLYVGKWIR